MKERPILFSGPMVRALLDGRKTQTRRIMKPQPVSVEIDAKTFENPTSGAMCIGYEACPPGWRPMPWFKFDEATNGRLEYLRPAVGGVGMTPARVRAASRRHGDSQKWAEGEVVGLCPHGQPGDRLWVRETWRPVHSGDPTRGAQYRADLHGADQTRWKPGIHMFRWASRITLELTGVRVERLQDISEADAKAEGVERFGQGWKHYFYPDEPESAWEFASNSYASLFDKINGAGSWDKNPWVWVLEFKRVTT